MNAGEHAEGHESPPAEHLAAEGHESPPAEHLAARRHLVAEGHEQPPAEHLAARRHLVAEGHEQPPLFAMPEQPHLVEKAKEFVHTGKITGKDGELCAAIVEAYASGLFSIRAISARLHVGRETVRTILRLAENGGKLGQAKQRVSAKMARAIETSLDVFMEKLDADKVPINVLPIAIGVFSDKKAMLDGDPTARLDVQGSIAIAPDVARDYIARLQQARARVIEAPPQLPPPAEAPH